MSRHDIVCVHTIVGYAPAHAAHFSVRGDGTILQSRDTVYKSGANLEGNHRVIAIENEDHGPHFPSWSGSNVPALTPAQVLANAQILRWAHETHGVPLQLCPNSLPSSRGLAYHRQGIDGNFTDGYPGRVPGGETWTLSYGKVCPGARRISQLPDILAAAGGATTQPEPLKEWDEMVTEAQFDAKLAAAIDGVVKHIDTTVRSFLCQASNSDDPAIVVVHRDGTATHVKDEGHMRIIRKDGVDHAGTDANGLPTPFKVRTLGELQSLEFTGDRPPGW
jgi:hypothetical protein